MYFDLKPLPQFITTVALSLGALFGAARLDAHSILGPTPRQLVFIDASIADAPALARAVRPDLEVVMLDPETDELGQMAAALRNLHGLTAIHLISHGAPGSLQLGTQTLDRPHLASREVELLAINHALRPGGALLLYGCNVAQGAEGQALVRTLARLTSANVAASTDFTGAADLGGNWTLEARTGGTSTPPPFVAGFQYHGLLPANQVINPNGSYIPVRPGGTSYNWTVGKSNTGTGPLYQVNNITYYNVTDPRFNWILTRGHYQYSTDGGGTWTTYTVTSNPNYVPVAGKLWRFVDSMPSDTNTFNNVAVAWNLVAGGPAGNTSTGELILPDNPPTDITADRTNILDNSTIGKALATLTPVDTGSTTLGYWALVSQSVPNLFVLTSDTTTGNTAALTLGAGALPADFHSATVTVHYYDMYQTDTNGLPISGQGIAKTFTFVVVPEAATNLNFTTDLAVNTYTSNDQNHAATTTLSDGSFVVVWQSAGEGGKADSTYYGIYGQRYTSTGTKTGSEFLISNAGSTVQETTPAVTPLAGGRFAVAYSSTVLGTNANIAFRLVETNGTVGSQIIVNTVHTNNAYAPVMATLTDGSFVVAWYNDSADIKLQQFAASNGATIGSQLTIAATAGYSPGLAALTTGSYAVCWVDITNYDVKLRVGTAGTIVDTGFYSPSGPPHLAGLTNGFVIVSDHYDTNSQLIYVKGARYNNSAVLQGSAFQVNANIPGNRMNSSVVTLPSGGFLAVWQSDYDDFELNGIFGRRFTSAGVATDAIDFQINQHRAGDQSLPAVTALTNDLFATAWTDIPITSINAGTYLGDIHARVLLPSSTGPTFTSTTNTLTVSQNSTTNDVRGLLFVSDTDSGKSLIWSQSIAPTNGTLSFVTATNASGSTNITPGGSITYTPTASYSGPDSFTVQVSDGTITVTRTISVTVLDTVPPTIVIGAPSVAITNGGSVTYVVTYADTHFNASTLASNNITVNKTGTASAGSVTVTGTGTTRTVTLSSLSGNGTLGLTIASGTASDLTGNLAPSAGPSATFTVDNILPTIVISAPSVSITNAGSVVYVVTYADANFNASTLTTGNITLNTTGTASAAIGVTGTGTTRTVTLSGITGAGTLGISIAAGTASDTAGNLAPVAGPSTTFIVASPPLITLQPVGQTAVFGSNPTFTATATGTAPLVYQWVKDGVALPGATNVALNLTNVTRANVGYYSLTVTNLAGGTSSTNALLRIIIPQVFGQVLQPTTSASSTFAALFRDTNGTVATVSYATNFFQMQGSTNIISDWEPVSGTMSLTNGWLLFQDNDPTNPVFHPYRFYRIKEQ